MIPAFSTDAMTTRAGTEKKVTGKFPSLKIALEKYERRAGVSSQSKGSQREDELNFDPVEKVIWEFECSHGVKVDEIAIKTLNGK